MAKGMSDSRAPIFGDVGARVDGNADLFEHSNASGMMQLSWARVAAGGVSPRYVAPGTEWAQLAH